MPCLLDAGCGPGRHALEFARRGWSVHGVDISPRFIELGREAAQAEGLDCTFRLGDLRRLDVEAAYDAVVCLCQGGFGLVGGGLDGDLEILRRLCRALRPGGRLALSAFNAFFVVKYPTEDSELSGLEFDPATGLHQEIAELRDPEGNTRRVHATTCCYTPRELRALSRLAGLHVIDVYGVSPGDYAERAPSVDLHEYLLLAERPLEPVSV